MGWCRAKSSCVIDGAINEILKIGCSSMGACKFNEFYGIIAYCYSYIISVFGYSLDGAFTRNYYQIGTKIYIMSR